MARTKIIFVGMELRESHLLISYLLTQETKLTVGMLYVQVIVTHNLWGFISCMFLDILSHMHCPLVRNWNICAKLFSTVYYKLTNCTSLRIPGRVLK